jgi:DNA-binding response OmpR family regulator
MRSKVLLVDDEEDTRTMYREILESEGYEVTLAETGERALTLVDGYQPDVILLDVMLPGKDGIEVARDLSRRADARHIPIIMITALSSFPVGMGFDSIEGIKRFIYKPCRPKTLLEGIDDVIRYKH